MNLETFRNLPHSQLVRLMRETGPKVCAFPVNGTRRWFMLEHALAQGQGSAAGFVDVISKRHIQLCQLPFDHGLPTLLMPVLGLHHTLERSENYMRIAAEGLARLATHPDFLDFYRSYGVRVRFYGDYGKFLAPTSYAYLLDLFNQVMTLTQAHTRHRLFFGLFANDPAETIAELAVQHYLAHGHPPDKQTLVELYYGEPIAPVDFFVGFSKFRAFDMPLLASGTEDLYFTVSPSPYLTRPQWRDILYDHLYLRRREPDWDSMQAEGITRLQAFYRANVGNTLGLGTTVEDVWVPRSQVTPAAYLGKGDN